MENKKIHDKTYDKDYDVIEKAEELQKLEEPKPKSETGIRVFILSMTIIMILAAALTERTYNGYDPNPHYVAITGFVAIVTIFITSAWYRTKYNNFSYKPEEFRRHYKRMKNDREKK